MSEKYLVYSHRVTALPLLRSRETCDTSDRLKGSTTEGVKMAVRNEKNDRVQRAVWSQLVATAGCRHALTVTELSGALLHRAPFLPKTFFLAFFPFPAFIFPLDTDRSSFSDDHANTSEFSRGKVLIAQEITPRWFLGYIHRVATDDF